MLTCHQDALHTAVSAVERAAASRTTLPVLENVKLAAADGRLELTATDLEVCLTQRLDASVEKPFETTVPARIFGDLVKQSPAKAITLGLNGSSELHFACEAITAAMKTIDAGEFPQITSADEVGDPVVTVPAELLAGMIREVAFAAATDESKPVLTGVLVTIEGDTLTMTAIDGFRMSERKETLATSVAEPVREVVPARSLQEFRRAIGAQETVQVYVTGRGQLLLSADDLEMVSQLIGGVYPDYSTIVPDTTKTSVTVNTKQLKRAVRRALIFARDSDNTVRFDADEKTLRLEGQANETGANEEELPAAVEGPTVKTALNGRYLTEALAPMEAERVVISLDSPMSPVVFRPAGGEKEWAQAIMPVTLGSNR